MEVLYVIMILASPVLLPLIWLTFQALNKLQSARYLSQWRHFAETNGLKYGQVASPWPFAGRTWPYAQGNYAGHHLHLRSYSQGVDTLTELTLTAITPPEPGAAKEALQWLRSTNWAILRGRISVEPGGQKLIYRQGGFEGDSQRLTQLAGLLVKLAAAYGAIRSLGTVAIPALQPLAASLEYRNFPIRLLARQLLMDIAQDTYTRLGSRRERVLCPRCLTHPAAYEIKLSLQEMLTLYGCRTCGQSQDILQGQIVAVLDARMEADYLERDDRVEVNWLRVQTPFDFEAVEIRQATDEQVERLVMQIGNDTDPLRKARYSQLECVIGPGCELSANSLRLLERFLGQVHLLAPPGRERLRARPALESTAEYNSAPYGDHLSSDPQDLSGIDASKL